MLQNLATHADGHTTVTARTCTWALLLSLHPNIKVVVTCLIEYNNCRVCNCEPPEGFSMACEALTLWGQIHP